MGVLSVKYNHKTLMVIGLLLISISAIGCWLSPSFLFILLAFPLKEIGASMVRPMSFSLVGSLLLKEKRYDIYDDIWSCSTHFLYSYEINII